MTTIGVLFFTISNKEKLKYIFSLENEINIYFVFVPCQQIQ
jgi:hypothetical protein